MGRKSKGRRLHSAGYVVLSGGRHGRYEHRVVAEAKLGRPLLPNEDVHHQDENKQNNDPSNLEVLLKPDHTRLHHPKQVVSLPCGQCGTMLQVYPCKLLPKYSKSGKVFCNNHCAGLFNNSRGVRGKPFDPAEKTDILAAFSSGLNFNQIAKRFNRSRESIRTLVLRERK